MGVAVADYNHTGLLSIYVTNFADEYNTLYENQGNGIFAMFLTTLAWPCIAAVGEVGDAFVDFDNDGWADRSAVNGQVYPQVDSIPSGARYRQPKTLYLNERNGTFWMRPNKRDQH